MWQYTGVIIIILIFVIGIPVALYMNKKRIRALENFAKSLGFEYSDLPDISLIKRWNLPLFSLGKKNIFNMLTKENDGVKITLVDYQYRVGGSQNGKTYAQTVLIYESELLNLPSFTLSHENILHKMGSVLGHKDINFDNFPKFSSQYQLNGKDEDKIRELFNSDKLNFFEQRKKINIEADKNIFIYYRVRKFVAVKDMKIFLNEGQRIFNLLKS